MEFHFIVSEPVRPFSIVRDFKAGLNAEQKAWWDDSANASAVQQIVAYLNLNRVNDVISDEAREFAEEAINAIINDNCTILNPDVLDEQITTTLPECLENLVDDLQSLQNGKFGQIISQFAGNNPVPLNYNWKVTVGNLSQNQAASTSPSVQYGGIVTTTINNSYINISTDLSLARTIIHEAFHAYLVSVYRYRNIDMSYVNLVNVYSSQFNNNLNDTHHHIYTMSTIIDEVATALQEYGVLKGYNLPSQFYEDMAWGGLLGTNAYNNLPENQKERIASTIASEQNNDNNNILGISPKGDTICP